MTVVAMLNADQFYTAVPCSKPTTVYYSLTEVVCPLAPELFTMSHNVSALPLSAVDYFGRGSLLFTL